MKFILIAGIYTDADPRRTKEMRDALALNIKNPFIEKIYLIAEDGKYESSFGDKVEIVDYGQRLTFDYLFSFANGLGDSPCIICNADIYFDETLGLIEDWYLKNSFLALSRWDVLHDRTVHIANPNSQDAWIFRPPTKIKADFKLGTWACDNKIAYEARESGLRVINPSASVKALHLHQSEVRNYKIEEPIGGLMNVPPVGYPINETKDAMKIISFSLYGRDPFYTTGAIRNAELGPIIYPGWTLKFFVGQEVEQHIIDKLKELGCEVEVRSEESMKVGMFWRFFAASDPRVKYAIFRDCDSRLNVREKAAVDEWIESGKACHIIRDHKNHAPCRILGGAWGVRGNLIDIPTIAQDWKFSGCYGDDMAFLSERVWDLICNDTIEHGWENAGPNRKPFPPHPAYDGFVGQRVDQNEVKYPN